MTKHALNYRYAGAFLLAVIVSFGVALLFVDLVAYDPAAPGPRATIDAVSKSGLEAFRFNFPRADLFVPDRELYSSFPAQLAFLEVPLPILRAAEKYRTTCREEDFLHADSVARAYSLSPSKLLSWHQAVCRGDLSEFAVWIKRTPLLHPTGISYAKLYFETEPSPEEGVQAVLEPLLHLNEKEALSDFDKWYLALTVDERHLYTLGHEIQMIGPWIVVDKGWDGRKHHVSVFDKNTVNTFLIERHGIELQALKEAKNCYFIFEQVCGTDVSTGSTIFRSSWFVVGAITLVLVLLTGALMIAYLDRRERRLIQSDQAFLFRAISHEVRTPLTSLGLALDRLRGNFDQFDEKTQKNLMEVLGAHYDLKKILAKSLGELSREKDDTQIEVNQFIEDLLKKNYQGIVSYNGPGKPVLIKSSQFWFEAILKNLIQNALKHGEGQVEVFVRELAARVEIEVRDEGRTPLHSLRSSLKSFVKGASSDGLGLGLSIVRRKTTEAGAVLSVLSEPTRFIISYPKVRTEP